MPSTPTTEQPAVQDRPVKHPILIPMLALLNLIAGAIGLVGVAYLALRWFGGDPASDILTRLIQDRASIRTTVTAFFSLISLASLLMLVSGVGLLKRRRWAVKVAFLYGVVALAAVALSLIVILSNFRHLLKTDDGTAKAVFHLTLSHTSDDPVTVAFSTEDGSAIAGADYLATNGVVTFPRGKNRRNVTAVVLGDREDEGEHETFFLRLDTPENATLSNDLATAMIIDDDGLPLLSAGAVTARELSRDKSKARLPVYLSRPSVSNVTARFTLADGTATAGTDYEAQTGTVLIPAGRTNRIIEVWVLGDQDKEGAAEEFYVNLSDAVGATITNGQGVVTIADDDGPPSMSVTDITLLEKHSDSRKAVFNVGLSRPSLSNITVRFTTSDGTAVAGEDFEPVDDTLLIPFGYTNKTVKILVLGDRKDEGISETFYLNISAADGAAIVKTQAVATIVDDDGLPGISLANAESPEGTGRTPKMVFPITLSYAARVDVAIDYKTVGGTAKAGADFEETSGTLVIPAGKTKGKIIVPIHGDTEDEGEHETFVLQLTGVRNGIIDDGEAVGTIKDDDELPAVYVGDVTLVEGHGAGDPEVVAKEQLAHIMAVGGGLIWILCPALILGLISRDSVLNTFKIDAKTRAYTAGTLTYTKIGLTALFAWLLWGDFCFTIMNAVVPTVLPLKLKALGASNTMISVILSTLPSILNLTVCPWVSFKSDRHRSRFGRRIPFIVWTLPFLTIALIMLGWSEDISGWLRLAVPALQGFAPNTTAIFLIGSFLVMFQFFNLFVNSVFWYLFNDVVPPQFLGRFMGLFRIAGTAASAMYQWYVFQYAETNMREILSGGALIYFFGFGLMCFMVKEGQYPPITGEEQYKRKGLLTDIKIFAKESFTVRFYWYFFLVGGISRIAYALAMFNIFFSKQMGLTLHQIGKLGAVGGMVGIVATYFTATLVDRWHPLRILTYQKLFTAVMGFSMWIWTLMTLPGELYFWMSMVGTIIAAFDYVLDDAAGIPCLMRILPKSRYGQFSSANAMIRSLATMVAGVVAGVYLDFLKWMCHGSDYAYRWMWTWIWPFNIMAAYCLIRGYQEWKRRGGDAHYRPPAPWDPSGFEEVIDKVKSSVGKPRAVLISLGLGWVCSILNIGLVALFMISMYKMDLMRSFWWHARIFLPIKGITSLLIIWQISSVWRDIRTVEKGGTPKYGIPHHGVILVETATALLQFIVYWIQVKWMIRIGMERELIIFGINTLISTFAHSLVATHILRVVERVQPPKTMEEVPVPEPVAAPQAT